MKAEIDFTELQATLAAVTKGIRGKHIKERARALLVFRETGVSLEFNNVVVNCDGQVSETGAYSLNPFTFRALVDTYPGGDVTVMIDQEGVTIGRARIEHGLIRGSLDQVEESVEAWKLEREAQLQKSDKRLEKQAEWIEAARNEPIDQLAHARHVAYRRVDGGVEYGAAVLKYEKGEPGHRRVYVKTRDFLEFCIGEVEIVSFGKDPKLPGAE